RHPALDDLVGHALHELAAKLTGAAASELADGVSDVTEGGRDVVPLDRRKDILGEQARHRVSTGGALGGPLTCLQRSPGGCLCGRLRDARASKLTGEVERAQNGRPDPLGPVSLTARVCRGIATRDDT